MAERIEVFQVLCPAGTDDATPQTTALTMDESIVERIEVTVPTGPSGFMGFRFLHSQQIIIPYKGSNWILVNGVELNWPVQGYPTGDKWSLQMYNLDIFDHTVYIRFHVNEIPNAAIPALPAFVIE